MAELSIARLRLTAQHLVNTSLSSPVELVNHLGAVQAQDFAGAKWAVGERLSGVKESAMTEAFDKGELLRTHVLRPTWHFVTPENIRWMLKLTAPRVKAVSAYYVRQLSIDDALTTKTNKIIEDTIAGSGPQTKTELCEALQKQHIDITNPLRATYLIMNAELDGLICSGPLRGKQHTYSLLRGRISELAPLPRVAALAKLGAMYFRSHGPATLKDFVWWSGLSVKDAGQALEAIKTSLQQLQIGTTTYWHAPGLTDKAAPVSVRLIPNYDEYIVAYADRRAAIDQEIVKQVDARSNVLFNNTIIVNGIVRGTWRRPKGKRLLELRLFTSFSGAEQQALQAAVDAYAAYLGAALTVAITELTIPGE